MCLRSMSIVNYVNRIVSFWLFFNEIFIYIIEIVNGQPLHRCQFGISSTFFSFRNIFFSFLRWRYTPICVCVCVCCVLYAVCTWCSVWRFSFPFYYLSIHSLIHAIQFNIIVYMESANPVYFWPWMVEMKIASTFHSI